MKRAWTEQQFAIVEIDGSSGIINVSVVGNVGGLKTEHLSHGKLLLKY